MNYNSCQYLNEYFSSVNAPNIPKKSYPALYQQQTSPSLSLSFSPSLSSSSAQELQQLQQQQQRRIDHNPAYTANRTNTYCPPVTATRTTASPIIDYNNNHTYYFVSTHRSIIQQCSDTFFLLTGYSPLELIGKSLADFLHPDDLYRYGHHVGANFPFIRFCKKDGQTLPLECKKITNFIQEVVYIGMTNTPSQPPTTSDIINVKAEFQNPSSCCMNFSTATTPSNNFYKNHRDILLRNYVCVDCGTTASPEWRRGPHGPKTLCNACGLRWAKKNKRK